MVRSEAGLLPPRLINSISVATVFESYVRQVAGFRLYVILPIRFGNRRPGVGLDKLRNEVCRKKPIGMPYEFRPHSRKVQLGRLCGSKI